MNSCSRKNSTNLPARAAALLLSTALLAASLGFPSTIVQSASFSAGAFMPHPVTPAFATDSRIPNDVQLGDVDGDGDLDALLVQFDRTQPDTIWYNDGTGRFLTSANLPLGPFTDAWGSSMNGVLIDVDNDSDLDAVISNFDEDKEENIWKNDGDGNFTWSTKFNSSDRTFWMAMGDLGGSSCPDMLMVQGYETESWVTYIQSDAGVFNLVTMNDEYDGLYIYHAALANFDNRSGSTDLDAVITGDFGASVKFNNGDGSFPTSPAPTGLYLRNGNTRVALTGDLDRDGDIDIVLGSPDAAAAAPGAPLNEITRSQVFLGNGLGGFTPGSLLPSPTGTYVRRGDIGDINGDGWLDVVLVNDNKTTDEIFLNDANADGDNIVEFIPNPATPTILAGTKTTSGRLGDIDGDGDLDLLTTHEQRLNGPTVVEAGGVKVWLNNAAPVEAVPDQTVTVGNLLSLNLDDYVSDPDGDPIAFHTPSVGSLTPAGVFTWTPDEPYIGTTPTVTFQVTDGRATTQGSFKVTVNKINQLPVLDVPVSGSYTAKIRIQIVVSGHDDDIPAEPLTYGYTGTLPAGAVFNPTTRTFTWTPGLAQVGEHVITFTLNDGRDTATFNRTFTILEPFQSYLPFIRRAP